MEIDVAVVAAGIDKDHTLFGERIDRLAEQGIAVERAHVVEAPAHVHHKPLLVGLCDGPHPIEGIEHGRGIHQEGAEEVLRLEGHAAVVEPCPAPTGDARHMAAVGGVTVDIGRIGTREQQVLRRVVGSAVGVPLRCRTGLLELVPSGTDAGLREQGVVEHGMRVVEAPIGDADEHVRAGVGLRQTDPAVYTVHAGIAAHTVQVRLHLAGELSVIQAAKVGETVEVLDVDAEGTHRAHLRTPVDDGSIAVALLRGLAPQEAHHAAAVEVGRGIAPLGDFGELARVGLLTSERLQVQQVGACGGGQDGRRNGRQRGSEGKSKSDEAHRGGMEGGRYDDQSETGSE